MLGTIFLASYVPASMPLDFASVLPNNEVFTIEVVAEGLEPGQTITGYNLGIYLDGGQQVAKVQNLDGSWPANYGYSDIFHLQQMKKE